MTEDSLADLVDAFVKALPLKEDICTCGCTFGEHVRLGRRNVYVCRGKEWKCRCIEFVKQSP